MPESINSVTLAGEIIAIDPKPNYGTVTVRLYDSQRNQDGSYTDTNDDVTVVVSGKSYKQDSLAKLKVGWAVKVEHAQLKIGKNGLYVACSRMPRALFLTAKKETAGASAGGGASYDDDSVPF